MVLKCPRSSRGHPHNRANITGIAMLLILLSGVTVRVSWFLGVVGISLVFVAQGGAAMGAGWAKGVNKVVRVQRGELAWVMMTDDSMWISPFGCTFCVDIIMKILS